MQVHFPVIVLWFHQYGVQNISLSQCYIMTKPPFSGLPYHLIVYADTCRRSCDSTLIKRNSIASIIECLQGNHIV